MERGQTQFEMHFKSWLDNNGYTLPGWGMVVTNVEEVNRHSDISEISGKIYRMRCRKASYLFSVKYNFAEDLLYVDTLQIVDVRRRRNVH